MNTKILLLNPVDSNNLSHIRVGRCQTQGQPGIACWPPIDLALISAAIKKECKSTEVFLYDAQIDKDYQKMIRFITSVSPQIVILNCTTPTFFSDIKLAKYIKSKNKEVFVIFYGLHATVQYSEILETGFIDCCVIGEPEETVCSIIQHYNEVNNECERFRKIANVAYLSYDRKVILNEQCEKHSNIFLSLTPDRSILSNMEYRLQYNNKPFTIIHTSRGCPYNCIFCTSSIYSHKYISRSVDSVISEITQCITDYNITNFMFLSDTFTADKQWIIRFCEEIIQKNICIEWVSNSRVDTIDSNLATLMRKAGCWLVSLGIESANEVILKNAKKNINLSQIKDAISIFKSVNIKTIGYFVFGLPGETKESIKETIEFSKKAGLDYAYYFHATPFPGTELYEMAQERGWLITQDWKRYAHGKEVIMSYNNISQKELKNAVRYAYRSFYFRPRTILMQMKTIQSWKVFYNNIQAAIALLKK
ncbi:MAG: radical SAM protein [Clostridiales bacterium]|nr:radical SAM protein [Clostridiales bacterium]